MEHTIDRNKRRRAAAPIGGLFILLAVIGLITVLVLCVVVLVSRLLISLSGDRIPVFNEETIGHSYVFRWLYTFNPFSGGWTALH